MTGALRGDLCEILGEKKDRDELAYGKLRSFLLTYIANLPEGPSDTLRERRSHPDVFFRLVD
jgi:hypothetical protein